MATSKLPGGIGTLADKLRSPADEPILAEVHVSLGQGLCLTREHLTVVRAGPFGLNAGSDTILVHDLRSVSFEANTEGFTLDFSHGGDAAITTQAFVSTRIVNRMELEKLIHSLHRVCDADILDLDVAFDRVDEARAEEQARLREERAEHERAQRELRVLSSKRELLTKFGHIRKRAPGLHSELKDALTYVGGVPSLDAFFLNKADELNRHRSKIDTSIAMVDWNDAIVLRLPVLSMPDARHAFLLMDGIESVELQEDVQRGIQEATGAGGSALVGGLLFGAVGALAGGLGAAGTPARERIGSSLLTIKYTDPELDFRTNALLTVKRQEVDTLVHFMEGVFADRFVNTPASVSEQEPVASGIAVELQRVADLHHQGLLTDEEFAAAKGKILGR